jgi:hypothetical protein
VFLKLFRVLDVLVADIAFHDCLLEKRSVGQAEEAVLRRHLCCLAGLTWAVGHNKCSKIGETRGREGHRL